MVLGGRERNFLTAIRGIEFGPRNGKTALRKNPTKHTNKTNGHSRLLSAVCVFFLPCSRARKARKGECSKYSKTLIVIDADLKSNYLLEWQRGARFVLSNCCTITPSRSPFVPSKFRNSHSLQVPYFVLTTM